MAALPLTGHGLVDVEIAEITRRLLENPGDADLLLRRATLHRAHEDLPAAKVDLQAVGQDSPRYPEALLHLARLEREQGNLAAAGEVLARYFAWGAAAAEAYREQARLHTTAQRSEGAAGAWGNYLRLAKQPTADEFLEASAAMVANRNPSGARLIVLQGLERFPASIPLHQRAAFHDLQAGRTSAAEDRLAGLRERYPTLLPRLYQEEGELWLGAKDAGKARECFERALDHLNQLPPSKQTQPGLRKLRLRIQKSLDS